MYGINRYTSEIADALKYKVSRGIYYYDYLRLFNFMVGPSLWGKCSLLGKACHFILLEQTNKQYVFNDKQWYVFIFLLKLLHQVVWNLELLKFGSLK